MIDDNTRCAGTIQPARGVLLGMCYGCARRTDGPSSLSGIAYITLNARGVHVWHCDARKDLPEPGGQT